MEKKRFMINFLVSADYYKFTDNHSTVEKARQYFEEINKFVLETKLEPKS
jgi:hypothetical protein